MRSGLFYAVRAEMLQQKQLRADSEVSRVEARWKTSTVALRVVGGDEKEVSNLRQ
jgi:hypothetical protein